MKKPWSECSREELLALKGSWEANLRTQNRRLSEAKRTAAASKVFLPLAELMAMEETRDKTAAGLRGLESELGKHKRKAGAFEEYFYEVADERLADGVFNDIYDEAKARHAAARKA